MVKTISAWSWPNRSRARVHAENQIALYSDHGLDVDLLSFNPPAGLQMCAIKSKFSVNIIKCNKDIII